MARQPRQVQTPDQPISVEHWAGGLQDSYLLCRDLGHNWRPYRAWWDAEVRGYQRVIRCNRCKTDRVQTLDSRGHAVTGHYVYPADYLAPKGTGRLIGDDRDVVRLASVLRSVESTTRKAG